MIPGSEFNMFCKPKGFGTEEYLNEHRLSTYDFHAKCKNKTREEVLEEVGKYPDVKMVFKDFIKYLKQWHDRMNNQSMYSAPISVTFNGTNFDIPIIKRMCVEYGFVDSKRKEPNIFYWRDSVDIKDMVYNWLEGSTDEPKSYKMDVLRPMFGINAALANAHDGLQDCRDQGQLFIKLLQVHRNCYKKIGWPWKKK